MAALIPYQVAGVTQSPFVYIFERMELPYAADLMNFVVLTAIISSPPKPLGNHPFFVKLLKPGACENPAYGNIPMIAAPPNKINTTSMRPYCA